MKPTNHKPILISPRLEKKSNKTTLITTFIIFSLALLILPNSKTQAKENDNAPPTQVEEKLDAIEIEQTQLIKQALKYDFFGQRCRGSSLTKHFNQTNRLFLSKYGFTANNYIKDFINPEIDEFKAELKQEFLKSLIKIGDCRGARELNWRKQMNDDFNRLFEDVEKSIWFPE